MSDKRIYNVVGTVVDLIPADSEDEAKRLLQNRLATKGFTLHESTPDDWNAFESEQLEPGMERAIREDAVARWGERR